MQCERCLRYTLFATALYKPHYEVSPTKNRSCCMHSVPAGLAGLLGPYLLCPLLLPGQLSPRGASAIRTRSDRVSRSTVPSPRHLRPSESAPVAAARRDRDRVPPTVYTTGDFWLFTSGDARAPRSAGEGPPGRGLESTARPTRSARSAGSRCGLRVRHLGPPASFARARPSLSPVRGPGL